MEKREKHYADLEAAAVAREKDTEALKDAMAPRAADFDAVLEEKRAAAAKEAEAFAQMCIRDSYVSRLPWRGDKQVLRLRARDGAFRACLLYTSRCV